jgi:Protein of unknown function (DUF3303)
MLFAVMYTVRDATEESQKRSLNLFTKWAPPAGYVFKAHYALCDGTGGLVIAETNSAAALLEAHAPWAPFFDFETIPLLEIESAVPIFQKVNAWRDSIR